MLQDLKSMNLKLNEIETKILEARLKGDCFGEMNADGLRYCTDKIIFSGGALFGCNLPQTEVFAQVLASEITVMLLDFGYADYTLDEVLLAMRMNARGGLRYPSGEEVRKTEFSGYYFNVSFVCEMLEKYAYFRNHLDAKFKNKIDGYE